MIGSLLDKTVLFSFDRSGFERHARRFDPRDLEVDLGGQVHLVTGASSGLGRAAAEELARLGAEVWLLCRGREKGRRALEEIAESTGNRRLRLGFLDLADLASVRRFAAEQAPERIDVLLHNAGVLPAARQETADGLELTLATHLAGPFLLTWSLLPRLAAAADPRVITVSSGGMYLRRLDLSDPQWRQRAYDGVAAYADTKRAQVVLNELWAERTAGSGVAFNAMHPGWADTPGVRTSLPRFHRLLGGRLRTPEQGADTMVWLAAAQRAGFVNGGFWFDRRQVPTHRLPWTRESAEERAELWHRCCGWAGLPDGATPELPTGDSDRE